ncbi:MAG: hypothetical protein OXI86_21125, partial [Candidatus Poribacteria bacterium]|nr:hypothetical protein [Candidatus Poribacteria bacterium]
RAIAAAFQGLLSHRIFDGIPIALLNQSVDRSFFIRLISPQKKMVGGAHPTTVHSCDAPPSTLVRSEAGAQCAPYNGINTDP